MKKLKKKAHLDCSTLAELFAGASAALPCQGEEGEKEGEKASERASKAGRSTHFLYKVNDSERSFGTCEASG